MMPGIWPTCSNTTGLAGAVGTICSPGGRPIGTRQVRSAYTTCATWCPRPDEDDLCQRADGHGRARPAALRPAPAGPQPPRDARGFAHARCTRPGLRAGVPARTREHGLASSVRAHAHGVAADGSALALRALAVHGGCHPAAGGALDPYVCGVRQVVR